MLRVRPPAGKPARRRSTAQARPDTSPHPRGPAADVPSTPRAQSRAAARLPLPAGRAPRRAPRAGCRARGRARRPAPAHRSARARAPRARRARRRSGNGGGELRRHSRRAVGVRSRRRSGETEAGVPVRERAADDQVLRDQRLEHVQRGAGDRLRSVERAAAGEDRGPRERRPLVGRQQRVAPFERRGQRALAGGRVARSRAERVQALVEPFRQLGRREQSDPGGRKLDCEREPVEAAADARDRRCVLLAEREARP